MKRFLRLTQEAEFGVYDDSEGAVAIWPRLDTANSFKPMTSPAFWQIMSGSGFAVPALFGSEVTGLGATLSTPLFYSQWSFLMGAAGTRINAGQTSPWTTTEAIGDLASFTADFGWSNFDGTIRRKRFLGCKIMNWGLAGTNDPTAAEIRATFALIASTPQGNTADSSADPDATAFPEPADTVFPTDPVLFQHLRSGLTIGTARTNFESFGISCQGKVKAYFDESRFANAIRIGGRSTTANVSLRLKATPDDRAAFEAATAKSLKFIFTNGTNTATIDCKAKNQITGHDEAMPLDEEIYYALGLQNYLDTSVPGDLVLSYA